MFAPFGLLVGLVLLALWFWLRGGAAAQGDGGAALAAGDAVRASGEGREGRGSAAGGGACRKHQAVHTVREGDNCWDLAQRYGVSVEELRRENEGLACEALGIGSRICITTTE